MKKFLLPAPVLLGAGGALLRFFQRRAAFEADTGLARPHPLSAVLLLYLLLTSAAFLLLSLRHKGRQLSFFHSFALPKAALPIDERPPFDMVGGAMLYLVSGGYLLAQSVGGGDVTPLIFAALSMVTGLSLLLTLRLWKGGGAPGKLLLTPVIFSLLRLLATYQEYASYPVTEAVYISVLAQAAAVLAFYQVAAHGFCAGRRRATWAALPVAILLSLTALADGGGLPGMGMYLAGALSLFAYWRCLGEYAPPEQEEAGGGQQTENGEG